PEMLMILESQFGKGMLHQLGGNLSSLLAQKGSLIGILLITPILFGMIFWYTSRNSDSKKGLWLNIISLILAASLFRNFSYTTVIGILAGIGSVMNLHRLLNRE